MSGNKDEKDEDKGLDVNRKPDMDSISGYQVGELTNDDGDEKPAAKDER